MLSEVAQRDPRGQHALHEVCGDARNQDLVAVADGQQARRPVHGRPEVVPIAFVRLAGMDRHPHLEAADRDPNSR